MYDFIGKEEYLSPEESLKKYLYFSGEDEEQPEYKVEGPELEPVNLCLTDLHRNDFQDLLRKSSLTEQQRKACFSHFVKTKRIFKRERAKMRWSSVVSAATSFVEEHTSGSHNHLEDKMVVEDNSTTKTDSEDRDEDQKRKKRMSAQISRDRKKMHIERIEAENRQLRLDNQKLQSENQRLRCGLVAWRKRHPHSTLDNSLKSIFIMSLILLTSVNKDKLESQMSSMGQETLLKGATNILEQYRSGQIKVKLPEVEDFRWELSKECQVKQEHFDMVLEPNGQRDTLQTYYSRCPIREVKEESYANEGVQIGRKTNRKSQKIQRQLVH